MNTQPNDAFAQAADWHSRLNDEDDSPEAYAQFEAWVAADPRHKQAFDAVERMWSQMSGLRLDPSIMDVRRGALKDIRRPRPHIVPYLAMAATVLLIVAAAYLALPQVRESFSGNTQTSGKGGTFRTAVGESSTVTLSDNSSIVLNTDTRVEVNFSQQRRDVRLLSGQAWFQVAKDARPFVVEAGDRRVTALGTAFDVRLGEHESVQVTLAEGRVSVEAIQSPLIRFIKSGPALAQLQPGETFTVSRHVPAAVRKADLSKIAGWRQGQIIFDNDTLADAVNEINRYSSTPVELADPALAGLRVSGVFKSGHSESFIETITGHYPIEASRVPGKIVLSPKIP